MGVESYFRKEQAKQLSEERGITKLYARDAMIKPVLLNPDDGVGIILKKLKKENVNACIVVAKDKTLIGQISDNDVIQLFLQQVKYEPLVKILNHGYRRKFIYKTAKDLINKHKSFVRLDTPINKVIELLWKEDFEYIPVLDFEDRVVGVMTPSSIINILKDY